MDLVLIFVVLPLATIIFSIALQRLLKCPILVAAVVFAIFLILTYTVFGTDFIIFAILFALLSFITAFLVSLFCRILRKLGNLEGRNLGCNCDDDDDDNDSRRRRRRNGSRCNCDTVSNSENGNLLTITSRCGNGDDTKLLSINSNGNCNNGNNNCNCGCNSNVADNIVLSAEVVPSSTGRSGCFRGNFRRCR